MSTDAYELIALTARYLFAALMLLIVLRAARLTAVDSRRAAKLRRLSPMTGVCGELVVLEGDGNARRGMRYPVIREGMIGSSGRADVRIRHKSVRRRHAFFQMTRQGLKLRDHANARLRNAEGDPVRELVLGDGGEFFVGRIRLLLVLSDAAMAQSEQPSARKDDLFGADPYDAGLPSEPRRVQASPWADEDDFDNPILRRMPQEERIVRTVEPHGERREDRMERHEEFRQAVRAGDALERRAASRASGAVRRAGSLNDRTARRVAGYEDGVGEMPPRPAGYEDGTTRRPVGFEDGIAGITRRSTGNEAGIDGKPRRSVEFEDGIAGTARRPAGNEAGTLRRPRSGEDMRRREVLPPEDLFLNDDTSGLDDEDW